MRTIVVLLITVCCVVTVHAQDPAVVEVGATGRSIEQLVTLEVGDAIGLDLGLDRVAVVTDRTALLGSWIWRGEIVGGGHFSLVARDASVTGLAHVEGVGSFRLAANGDAVDWQRLDGSRYPRCGCEKTPRRSRGGGGAAAAGTGCDDGSVIDVMIVYTPIARFAAGGTAAIEAEAILAVDVTNQAYANSLVPLTINLVHLSEVDYDEFGTYVGHLGFLENPVDGIIDEVHVIRNEVRADMVGMLVDDNQYCGIANLMNADEVGPDFEAEAFSVTSWFCAAGNLSFPHELGHNQGSHHDRDNAGSEPAYPFSYGYRFFGDSGDQWRTVMAYSPGTRVPHFSNPRVSYDGGVTGVAEGQIEPSAMNAMSIGLTAPVVASFRCRLTADIDGDGDVDVEDLLAVLAAWGPCEGCPADLDGDGFVTVTDLLLVLAQWG